MKVPKNIKITNCNFLNQQDIRSILAEELKTSAIYFVNDLLKAEIQELCGELFQRKNTDYYHRAGTNPGSILLEGQRVKITKPRVKHNKKEVELNTYKALQDYDLLQDKVVNHMLHGVSTRNYNNLLKEVSKGIGLSKSSVSRVFKTGSRKSLDLINTRSLSGFNILNIMIDGIEFGGKMLLVCIGITESMHKVTLGIRLGDSENAEVCKDLLTSIVDRGLEVNKKYLFTLDGSKALKTAVKKVFGVNTSIQRCVRHKERNIISYLPKQHHAEFRRQWKMIHGSVKIEEAKNELKKLNHWLQNINLEAHKSLEEAEDETLTVVKLQIPKKFRSTFMSTNPIESIFSEVRERTHRIKRWKKNGDQVTRWCASLLLSIEHKKSGKSYKKAEITKIKNNLQEINNLNIEKEAA